MISNLPHHFPTKRFARAIVAAMVALAAITSSSSGQEFKAGADAFGVRFIRLPDPSKIADLIKAEGTLVELPLTSLEERLERLARREASGRTPPRIVKATYRAELVDGALTRGSGQWFIEHVDKQPAVLPLPSFNLAIKQPRQGGAEAILGDLDGKNFGLWIAESGAQSVAFDWSLRGQANEHGIAFDLRIPACPLTTIELRVPADQSLLLTKANGLLTGPHETENPAFKQWRLSVAGRTQIELLARRGHDVGRPTRLFATSEARVQFTPEQTLYDVDFQIEALHSPIRVLTFDVDAPWQAIDVQSRSAVLANWKTEPAPVGKWGNGRQRLVVQLREPLLGTLTGLKLRFVGPRWSEQEAPLPAIELAGGISRSETLKLYLHGDQQLERFDRGSFRWISTATDADGGQTLTLSDSPVDGRGLRPRLQVRSEANELSVRTDLQWRLGSSGMTLSADLACDVNRGRVFALDVRLPKNAPWQVATVEMEPRDMLRRWSVAGGILRVELQRGLTSRSAGKLNVQLTASAPTGNNAGATIVDFPDLDILGAVSKSGSLAILADGHEPLTLIQSNVPTSRPPTNLAKEPRLQFYFTHPQSGPLGKVQLWRQNAVLQVRVKERATLSPDACKIFATLEIEPIIGQVRHVELFLSGDDGATWTFEAKGSTSITAERTPFADHAAVALRMAAGPIGNFAGLAMAESIIPRGNVWRLTFREPLTKNVAITVRCELLPKPSIVANSTPPPSLNLDHGIGLAAATVALRFEHSWEVPIVIPLGVEQTRGEIVVAPIQGELTSVKERGLTPIESSSASRTFERSFRFERAGLIAAPNLVAKSAIRNVDPVDRAIIESADLTVRIDDVGLATNSLQLRVLDWRHRTLRVTLPRDAIVVGVRLNRIALDHVPRTDVSKGIDVEVPMSDEPGVQVVDITYREAKDSWLGSLGLTACARMPTMTVTPLAMSRKLELPRGWLPLRQESMNSLDRVDPAAETLGRVWRLGSEWVDALFPTVPNADLEVQRATLINAEAGLGRTGTREATFGDALLRLTGEPLAIVIDRDAVDRLGITAGSPVVFTPEDSTAFWESLGLAYVATPKAVLLTSRESANAWTRAVRHSTMTGQSLSTAVGVAAARGQDGAGRFVAADVWIRTEAGDGPNLLPRSSGDRLDGTTWTPRFGGYVGDDIVIVKSSRVLWLAMMFALAWGAICLALRQTLSPTAYFRFLWLALAIAAAVAVYLPASIRELSAIPATAIVLMLVFAYVKLVSFPERPNVPSPESPPSLSPGRSTHKAERASLTCAAIVALAAFGAAVAQAPDARTVYVIGDKDEAKAFVSQETLRWLDDRENKQRPTIADAVFLASRYRGRTNVDGTTFHADFDVVTFAKDVTLTVPLSGVDLLDGSLVDGTPAFPIVAAGGRTGFQVVIAEKGLHHVTLSFNVKPQPTSDIRFTGPTTPSTSLTFVSSLKQGEPRLVKGWGEMDVKRDSAKGERTLLAELGREPTVHIQGLSNSKTAVSDVVQVREAYSWDLRAGNRSLLGLWSFTSASTATIFEFQVPNSLETRSVERVESATRPSADVKSWRTIPRGDHHVLTVELAQPAENEFSLLATFVPRLPSPGGSVELRPPFPMNATVVDGEMALRSDDVCAVEKRQAIGLGPLALEVFAKDWSKRTRREAMPSLAFTFQRATKSPWLAAVVLSPQLAKPRVNVELALTALPRVIEVASRFNIASVEEFHHVAISVPESITLRDIRGPDVHHWTRRGGTIDVWLLEPRKRIELTAEGWVPHAYPKSKSFSVAPLRIVNAIVEGATVTIDPAAGISVEPKSPGDLAEEPVESPRRRFRIRGEPWPTEFVLQPTFASAECQTLTSAIFQGSRGTFRSTLHARIDQGEFPELRIRAKNWPTPTPRLVVQTPGAKIKREGGDEPAWTVGMPTGTARQISLSIEGEVTLAPTEQVAMPEIVVEQGGRMIASYHAISGVRPTNATATKMSTVRSSSKELQPWPVEHARLRAIGARYGRSGVEGLSVSVSANVIKPAAWSLGSHQSILPCDERHWRHRATWSILTTTPADVNLRLPPGATPAAVLVDDRTIAPRRTGPTEWGLSLPGGAIPRSMRVEWFEPRTFETPATPSIEPARLLGIADAGQTQTIFIPANWSVESAPLSLVDSMIDQAESRAKGLTVLADETAGSPVPNPALVEPMQTLSAMIRLVRDRCRWERDENAESRSRNARVSALDAEVNSLAKKLNLESARQLGDAQPWRSPPFERFSGSEVGSPLGLSEAASAPTLSAISDRPWRNFVTPIALAVVLLAFWPLGLWVWVRLWPEQLAAAALAFAFALRGFSLMGSALVLVAVLARAISLTSFSRRLVRRWWKGPRSG